MRYELRAAPAAARQDGRLRHPRPERGARPVRPHRRPLPGPDRADRHPGRDLRAAGERLRRRLHRQLQRPPGRGARRRRRRRHRRADRARARPRDPPRPGRRRGRRSRCSCGPSGSRWRAGRDGAGTAANRFTARVRDVTYLGEDLHLRRARRGPAAAPRVDQEQQGDARHRRRARPRPGDRPRGHPRAAPVAGRCGAGGAPYWALFVGPYGLYLLVFLVLPFLNVALLSVYLHSPTKIAVAEFTARQLREAVGAVLRAICSCARSGCR